MIRKICILFLILMTYNQLYAQISIKKRNIKKRIIPNFVISCSFNAQNTLGEKQNGCCIKPFEYPDSLSISIKLTDYSQILPIKKGKLSVRIYYGVSDATSSCDWCDYNLEQSNMSYSTDSTFTKNISTADFKKAKEFNIFKGGNDVVNQLEFNKIKLPYTSHRNYFSERNLFINRIYIEVKVKGLGRKTITYQHIIPVEVTH